MDFGARDSYGSHNTAFSNTKTEHLVKHECRARMLSDRPGVSDKLWSRLTVEDVKYWISSHKIDIEAWASSNFSDHSVGPIYNHTAIMCLVLHGNADVLEYLLTMESVISTINFVTMHPKTVDCGRNALMMAVDSEINCTSGYRMCTALIHAKADVDCSLTGGFFWDVAGDTSLHLMMRQACAHARNKRLYSRENENRVRGLSYIQQVERTLSQALPQNRMIHFLITMKADISAQNCLGETPIEVARVDNRQSGGETIGFSRKDVRSAKTAFKLAVESRVLAIYQILALLSTCNNRLSCNSKCTSVLRDENIFINIGKHMSSDSNPSLNNSLLHRYRTELSIA